MEYFVRNYRSAIVPELIKIRDILLKDSIPDWIIK